MPQGVTYDVNAFLRTQGSFQKEMRGSARAADSLGKSYGSMSDRLVAGGERVRGTFAATARDMARGAVFAGAAGIAGGVAMAAREGIRFNDQMEQGRLGLATMYQLFGVATSSTKVMSGEMTNFAKSSELAAAMQQELFDIAKKSPATFEDIATAYTAMAPGLTGVTKDLKRQRDLSEKTALLAFTTGGDYKQMGADIGRIVRGLAGADVAVFSQLQPNIKAAYEEITGKKVSGDFAQVFNKLAKSSGESALAVLEKAVDAVSAEAAAAFGASYGGLVSTMKSELQTMAGSFAGSLVTSIKKALKRATGKVGLATFGEGINTLKFAAMFAGQQLAKAADKLFDALHRGAWFVANNWQMIATRIQEAGVLAGAALKAASVIATARLVAGYGMIAVGKGAAAAQAIGGGMGRARAGVKKFAQAEHLRRGRRLRERGPSRVQKGFGVLAGLLGVKLGPNLDRTILRFATMSTVLAAGALTMGGLVIAFSAVAVVVGGLTAFLVDSWSEIKSSIVTAMMDGTISLIPLITAFYTFWERLKLVGQAMFGNLTGAGMMATALDLLTGSVNFASSTLGGMISVVAFGIEVWGALKLGLAAVFQLIGDGLRMMAEIPGVGAGLDGAIKAIDKMTISTHDSAQDTFQTARKFQDAANAISNTTLSPMQLATAEKKAKSLEQSLSDMLSGKDEDGKKGGGRKGKQTKVDANIVINTNDPDMDRVMAGIINWAERASDKRTQAYEGPAEQGV